MQKNKPLFIGLAGRKQVGKSTSADFLCADILPTFCKTGRVSFASSLKEMCVGILGLNPIYVYGNDEQKNSHTHIMWENMPLEVRSAAAQMRPDKWLPTGPMTAREVMQYVGSNIFRKMYSNVWADALFRADWSDCDYVIIDDTRFPNEVSAIQERNGIIIKLERAIAPKSDHISETALDGMLFKYSYNNDGSLEDLKNFLTNVIKKEKII